ncbi:MAG: DUF4339 domain-containing protein [Planctomycetales bacterium]|nr:DUF4339 domain-containing protein [Planctomycetales bacterium]MBN8627228.1 DUF4339 domain-containing protein [Planctomycetota bacterium]
MSITFYCTCGKKLKAKAAQAGRRGQCTSCGRALAIPTESTAAPVVAPPSIEALWYFAHDGRMFGPLGADDLRELAKGGQLSPGDWVLRPGAAEWTAARDVPELFPPPPVLPILVAAMPTVAGPPSPSAPATQFDSRRHVLAEAQVVPDASRCVQCGICTHNCPMGIDVRAHARRGRPIHDSRCLTCSECVNRCPRGVLQFERLTLFGLET